MSNKAGSLGLPVVVALAGFAIASIFALRSLAAADWDPTLFTSFGEEAVETTEFAEDRLGEVYLRSGQGHDGKFFFVQANDPWVLDPEENAAVLDRPLYRSQRMLYPTLASLFGTLEPEPIVWGLLVVNLIFMGLGTFATAVLAQSMGGSAWLGLAFGLNFGLISEVAISGAGVVAAAAAFAAVALVERDRVGWAVALMSFSVLTREAMLIAVAGIAFWMWRRGRRADAARMVAVPVAAALGWAAYLRLRIEPDLGVDQVEEIGWPFAGFIEAFPGWLDEPLSLLAGVAIMTLLLVFVRRTLSSQALLAWAFVGFAPLAVLFSQQVWQSYFDISRAVGPLITAFVLLLFLDRSNPAQQAELESSGSV